MVGFEVGVVGAGHVGLATGACLAHLGNRTVFVDHDPERVRLLRAGRVPIHEPHLEELLRESPGRVEFTTRLAGAVGSCDVLFIAVDTPQDGDGLVDLSNVADVARGIGRALAVTERARPLVVVNKSTVPVGSGDYVSGLVEEGLREAGGQGECRVVSNPEFLREGEAVYDSLYPDRIVLGGASAEALETMRELYRPIMERGFEPVAGVEPPSAAGPVPFVSTDLASAEMIKYAANAFLATKISFANEISGICELVGADIQSVTHGMGLDERIGPRFLNAGIGWGGSCFPKDVAALRSIAREYEYDPPILEAAVKVNDRQRRRVISRLQAELDTLKGKRVALLGLAFKPGTDDLRQAPSLDIARALYSRGARVVGYDPVAGETAAAREPGLRAVPDPYEALAGAHAAVLVTEWKELRTLDLRRAASLMQDPKLLVDGRNALDPREARSHGLIYRGFGRG